MDGDDDLWKVDADIRGERVGSTLHRLRFGERSKTKGFGLVRVGFERERERRQRPSGLREKEKDSDNVLGLREREKSKTVEFGGCGCGIDFDGGVIEFSRVWWMWNRPWRRGNWTAQ
ncbi:unnamed protein product [Arabidopsis halleri]